MGIYHKDMLDTNDRKWKLITNSIAILNWNMPIKSLRENLTNISRDAFEEIILVDNGSKNSKCVRALMRDEFPNVKLIQSGMNRGFSLGKNIGIKATHGDYVFLLNSDIQYTPGTLAAYQPVLRDLFVERDVVNLGKFRLQPTLQEGVGTIGSQNPKNQIAWAISSIGWMDNLKVYSGIPISWLHYGLYIGSVLRDNLLHEGYPFDRPGHGYEDDWHYYQLKEKGFETAFAEEPYYVHDQEISKDALVNEEVKVEPETRRQAFEEKWGVGNWSNRLANGYNSIIQLR